MTTVQEAIAMLNKDLRLPNSFESPLSWERCLTTWADRKIELQNGLDDFLAAGTVDMTFEGIVVTDAWPDYSTLKRSLR